MKFSTNTRTYWKRKNRCNTTEMRELPYQSLTSGRYCARYNSNRRDGLAIHTSSKQFAMAITIRCAHRSGFMIVGGRTKSLRVYQVKKVKEILACDSTRKTSFRMKKKKRGFWCLHAFVSWSALQFNDEKQIPKKTEQPIKGGLCALPFRWSESRESKKNPREKKNDGLQAAWNSGRERTKSGCLLSSRVPRDALASYFFPGFFFFFFLLTFHDRHRRKRGNALRLNHSWGKYKLPAMSLS